MKWIHGIRARLGLMNGQAAEERMEDEMRFHLEMATEQHVREGMTEAEARRRAAVEFGGVEGHKESMREERTLAWLNGVSLDIRLGLRMLRKYPMLTLVGGIAITLAAAIGTGASEFMHDLLAPSLPLEEGDRIVRLYQVDRERGGNTAPSSYDLEQWRSAVPAVEDMGGFTTLEQGLVSDQGETGTVNLARISASAFRVTRVPPLLGRFLLDSDEGSEAEPVVVLGFDAWQRYLNADPNVVGRVIQLGGRPTTVVGVMPEGYGFPEVQNAWVTLPPVASVEPETAPRLSLFGRLAPGAELTTARAQLESVGARMAEDHPEVYERLEPRIDEFARRMSEGQMTMALSIARVMLILLVMVASANVATLIFARTVMREGEIAVRRSLGATRRRIVVQLFAETLVLVVGSTAMGLGLAWLALGPISSLFFDIQQSPQPFWWNGAMSLGTVMYAAALALVGAVMVGVVPALKATGGVMRQRLDLLSTGTNTGLKFGGVWTVVIVLQVALTVAYLPLAVSQAGATFNAERSGFPAEEYVTGQLGRDAASAGIGADPDPAFLSSSRQLFETVRTRLEEDPRVESVAFASGLSAMNHVLAPLQIPTDTGMVSARSRVLLVDEAYLPLMGAEVIAGEGLRPADFRPDSRSVVVNQAFVDAFLGGRSPVGRSIWLPERQGEASFVKVPAAETTVEVVGVVANPGIDQYGPGVHPAIYAPIDLAPVDAQAVGLAGMPQAPATQLFVRTRSDAEGVAALLYQTVAAVDPTLRVSAVQTAAEAWRPVHTGGRIAEWIFGAVAGVVLLLSVAGIYALMSFTVSRRTREIAIRTAVGAPRASVLRSVFGRAALQLGSGVVLGGILAVPQLWDGVADEGPRTLIIVSLLLLGAGLIACLIPVRRALAIHPTVAMRTGG